LKRCAAASRIMRQNRPECVFETRKRIRTAIPAGFTLQVLPEGKDMPGIVWDSAVPVKVFKKVMRSKDTQVFMWGRGAETETVVTYNLEWRRRK
jgi:hypothetical protein